MRRHLLAAVAAIVSTALLAPLPADAEPLPARVVRWVDGDTVVTTGGEVRLIGVDTPERGRCGYRAATRTARAVAPAGSRVRLLNPAGVDDRDRWGRALRYVVRGRSDIGARQIKAGARARYDSRDGYDRHPRQARYRGLDARHHNYRCGGGGGGGGGGGADTRSYPPAGPYRCPRRARIKGNAQSMIYHMPWNAYYDATNPEECFATRAGARRAGYRAARV